MADQHKDDAKKQDRQAARGAGVDQPVSMSGYRTSKRESDDDYLAEAAGLPGVNMPNAPKAGKEQQQGSKAGNGQKLGKKD